MSADALPPAPARRVGMFVRIFMVWLGLSVVVGLLAYGDTLGWSIHERPLPGFFLIHQDLPALLGVMAGLGVILALAPVAARRVWSTDKVSPGRQGPRWLPIPFRAPVLVALLALACCVVGVVGVHWVFDNYPLSMDEFMANFDAAILRRGDLMAPVAPVWRADISALGPQFLLHPAGGAYWVSAYLPVNAALRALGDLIGASGLVSPVLAGISVVAVFGVARRLWPDRPPIAWRAAVLLATSSQFLITAMTPYAMTAHLAFNLVWLWLFLSDRPWAPSAAILVGFLACGLHQLAFHALFVAPFIMQLWLDRRLGLAGFYTLAYAVICSFWVAYPALAAQLADPSMTVKAMGEGGTLWFVTHPQLSVTGIGTMAKNLIRFATWQNPLVFPMVLLGAGAAWRAKGSIRALLLGFLITLPVVYVVMPYQGHGWGYRYVHGLLGSACLLAAWAWSDFSEGLDAAGQARSRIAFYAVAGAALLILLPVRVWQARRFVHPYAMAEAQIRGANTGAVIVDDAGMWFGLDLVRNDPYLTNRPLVFYRPFLNDARLRDLCARSTISVFDRTDAARLGVRTSPVPTSGRAPDLKTVVQGMKCGMTPNDGGQTSNGKIGG